MRIIFALLITAACSALSGCGKGKEPSAASGSSDGSAGTSPPAPAYVTAHAQNAPAENVAGVVDPFLTQQLGIFIQQKGRMPESFAELARTRLDSVPNPPTGKKWAIDTASKEVKAVVAK